MSFVVGLIRSLKSPTTAVEEREIHLYILNRLIMGDAVDKDVIAEVIDFRINHVKSYEEALFIMNAAHWMFALTSASNVTQPNTSRFAAGIAEGLIGMCMELLHHVRDDELADSIWSLLKYAFSSSIGERGFTRHCFPV